MDYLFLPQGKTPSQVSFLDLSGRHLKAIPNEIFLCQNLRKLYLRHNCLESVPDSIRKLRKLEVLDVSFNRLTTLPSTLLSLPELHTLSAGHNRIGTFPHKIVSSGIVNLILDYNDMDFLVPSSIVGLKKLVISHNRLNVGIIHTVLPVMEYLDIRKNPCMFIARKEECLPACKRYYHDGMCENALSLEYDGGGRGVIEIE